MSKRRLNGLSILTAGVFATVFLLAGCGGSVKSAVSGLASSHGITISPPSLPSRQPASAPVTPEANTPPPTQEQPTAAPAPSAENTATATSGSNSALLWVLIGLAAVVIFGTILWFSRASGRRSAAAARWQSRVVDAYAKGAALDDAIRIAEAPGALTAPDATARWADIQRRADDLAQAFYAMREAAPDEDKQARVADALGSLQALRSAMAAERGPDGASVPPERIRSRLVSFEAALRALRAPDEGRPY